MFDCTCPAGYGDIDLDSRITVDLLDVCARHAGMAAVRRAIKTDHAGRIAVVSSFGSESAVLLALVADIDPTDAEIAAHDPPGELWRFDPDACCRFRKVTPLDRALAPFTAWVTGRKR